MPKDLKIRIETTGPGQPAVLYLSGNIDSFSSRQLAYFIQTLLGEGKNKLVFDLSEVAYISSAGVSVFLTAQAHAQAAGGDILFLNMRESIRAGALKMLGLTELIKVAPDLSSAMDQLR